MVSPGGAFWSVLAMESVAFWVWNPRVACLLWHDNLDASAALPFSIKKRGNWIS
jgi:hypothetical protein